MFSGVGTLITSTGITLFTISKPSMSYWDLEFSAMWLSVLGVDFVFPSGSLFIAKFALPYEQSMAGALFTAMTQVRWLWFISEWWMIYNADRIIFFFGTTVAWHCIRDSCNDSRVQWRHPRTTTRCGFDCQLSCCELDKCRILFDRYVLQTDFPFLFS